MHSRRKCTWLLLSITLCWGALAERAGFAQARIAAEAFSGEPFGVGRITIELPKESLPVPLGVEGLGLSEKSGRALYPILSVPAFGGIAKDVLEATPLLNRGPVRQGVRGLLSDILDIPPPLTIFFLFRGDGPLELAVQARTAHAAVVSPQRNAAAHRRLLQAWWAQYTAAPKFLEKKPDYAPLVRNYLKATLARRLNLPLPAREQTPSAREALTKELGLLLGNESIRMAMEQDRLLGLHNLAQQADQPLPPPLEPPPLDIPEPPADVAIEPLAMRVPAECYYVRFGSFDNFLWLEDTLARWGGDLQNLVAARGVDYGINRRIEEQLVLKTNVLARVLGGTVVADVAIIGTDTFFREGAAYGMLFQARNNLALSTDFLGQRQDRLSAGGVTEQKIKIAGHDVSCLASPDGSVRSYYAVDGDYHLVATSPTLVKRFLETGTGAGALGASKEFRHARTIMPLTREDTIGIYVSDACFRNLTAPHYRLEIARRLQAATDIEIVQLAVLAAAAEGKPGGTIEKLIAGGLLPPDFGPRGDGSRTVLEGGAAYDSLRGRRAALLPVPDVPVQAATAAEITDYGRFADFYEQNWGRMDPILIGMKRQALPGEREQVAIDVRMSPLAVKHFQFLSQWAGPPDKMQIPAVPGDIAHGELVLSNQHIFAGLRDFGPPPELAGERFALIGRLRDVLVGYIGTTGQGGLLGFLDRPIPLPPGLPGGPLGLLGALRQQTDQFTVYSLQPDVLATVVPQLHLQEAPRPAQLRLWIGDVSQARVTPFLNNWVYQQTQQTCANNLRLMHDLDQQLHVPPKDCKEAAEFLLDATLTCPLGGQYVYRQSPGEISQWASSGLEDGGQHALPTNRAPEGYQGPPLSWFRGLDLDATMVQEAFSAHADVLVQLPITNK